MAYDCRFQATLKDHIPQEYIRYISKEGKYKVKLPEEKQMFVKKCMVPALYRNIPPSPSSILMERVKRNGLKHSIFNCGGDVYIGEWKNDKKEGHGSFKTHSGKVMYEGEWVNGKAEGHGVLCHQGDHKRYNIEYEGFWKDGKPQAKGYNYYKDGSYYKGGWENGLRNGFGKMWYADGTYYEGDFYHDKRHGRGLFVCANGNRYIGDWNANFKHGFGAYYYMKSGQIQMGHWIKDSCVNSWMVDMKYRQTVENPTQFSIPEKTQVVKQFKRVDVSRENESRKTIDRISSTERRFQSRVDVSRENESIKETIDRISSTERRFQRRKSYGYFNDFEQSDTDAVPPQEVPVEKPRRRERNTLQRSNVEFWKQVTTSPI